MELNVREENLRDLFKQFQVEHNENCETVFIDNNDEHLENYLNESNTVYLPVSYTHLRAHETGRNLVCRLLLEKKKKKKIKANF